MYDSFQSAKYQIPYEQLQQQYNTHQSVPLSLEQTLNEEIVGYPEIKNVILKIIDAGINKPELKKVDLLLAGEKATGKTAIFDAMIKGIGEQYCIKYDASMSTRVGLLDHLYSFKDRLSEIKYIVFDELDKMTKLNQYGVLNCLESGIMSETKFRRHREVDVRGSTFFGTANEIKLVYPPLASRFMVLKMNRYNDRQFNTIALRKLSKMNVPDVLARDILMTINIELPDKTIRDVVRLGTLANNQVDVTDITQLFRLHRLEFT
jgi:ATP-dependent Lon protease